MRFGKFLLSTATLGLLALGATGSQAEVILSVQQDGSNVVVTGSGSAITTGLSGFGESTGAIIAPALDALTDGPTGSLSAIDYSGVTGPSDLGSGNLTDASSGTGQRFGLDSFGPGAPLLQVPGGYTSGSALSGTSTYDNVTLASLGITPGTYVYSFGSGPTSDTLVIEVGPTSATPEPGSVALLATCALSGAGLLVRRRKLARLAA